MKKFLARTLGVILIVGAILGMVLSLSGLTTFWSSRPELEQQVDQGISLVTRTVDQTEKLLVAVDTSLTQAQTSLLTMKSIMGNTASALESVSPALETVGNVVGDDLKTTVENTQTSLSSVAVSAELIDNTLRLISAIPFIGAAYAPKVPISTSVAQIVDTLAPLPEKLTSIKDDLATASSKLDNVQKELKGLSSDLDQYEDSLIQARQVVTEYQMILTELRTGVDKANGTIHHWIDFGYWGVTLVLVWMVIAQLGLLVQGLGLLQARRELV